jgi:hypothetical protein
MGHDLDVVSATSRVDDVAISIQATLTDISNFLSGDVSDELTSEENLGETFRAMLTELGLVLPQEGEGIGAGGLLGLLRGGMFAGDEDQQSENPFQAMIAQAITNMLAVGEGEENPLQPLFDELDVHVKGEGESAGKGGAGKFDERNSH